jgi:prolyl-tRNA editing enzyme YbaK/EbsC (Cys-tRNA(Pro) deacylase)
VPEQVKELTGAEAGRVPLVNPGLKTIVNARGIEIGTVFGGTGVPNSTLRISPQAVMMVTQAQVFDFAVPKEND